MEIANYISCVIGFLCFLGFIVILLEFRDLKMEFLDLFDRFEIVEDMLDDNSEHIEKLKSELDDKYYTLKTIEEDDNLKINDLYQQLSDIKDQIEDLENAQGDLGNTVLNHIMYGDKGDDMTVCDVDDSSYQDDDNTY